MFPTLKAAQTAALRAFFAADDSAVGISVDSAVAKIMENTDEIVDILTTKETSLTRARRINGGKKQRKAATETPQPTAA